MINIDIFKIVGMGAVATVLAATLKSHRPEIAIQISLICAVLIFLTVVPYLRLIIDMLGEIADKFNINIEYLTSILKIIGTAYIIQFGAELCKDAGEGAIAAKIEFAGKVIIFVMSLPIIYSLINLVLGLVN